MTDDILKKRIGGNIAAYRKRMGLTQVGLADKLNYSDKAVSKWERGESMPDVLTLLQLSELFEISVDTLLADPNALPENPGMVSRAVEKAVEKTFKRKANKSIILKLCTILVWFIALLVFVVFSSAGVPKGWMAFVYAIPVNAIVSLSLCSAWRDFRRNPLWISGIVWGSLISIHLSLLMFAGVNNMQIYLLGIPGQLAVFLWFRMFRKVPSGEEVDHGQESPAPADPSAQAGDDLGAD